MMKKDAHQKMLNAQTSSEQEGGGRFQWLAPFSRRVAARTLESCSRPIRQAALPHWGAQATLPPSPASHAPVIGAAASEPGAFEANRALCRIEVPRTRSLGAPGSRRRRRRLRAWEGAPPGIPLPPHGLNPPSPLPNQALNRGQVSVVAWTGGGDGEGCWGEMGHGPHRLA